MCTQTRRSRPAVQLTRCALLLAGALGTGDSARGGPARGGPGTLQTPQQDPWAQVAYLKASNPDEIDHFGWSVAASGDTLLVGARGEDSAAQGTGGKEHDNSAYGSGAAYAFVREGRSWRQEGYLKPSLAGTRDFGIAVAVDGDLAVVGSSSESAHVFERSGGAWRAAAVLESPAMTEPSGFGRAVAVFEDTIVIGAPYDATGRRGQPGQLPYSGAVYVFEHNGSSWRQEEFLKASNADPGDLFGTAVAIDDGTIVVGASAEASAGLGAYADPTDNSASAAGAIYVFDRGASSWFQVGYLKATHSAREYRLGSSVDIHGEVIVAGSPQEDPGGAVYTYKRFGSSWLPQTRLTASNSNVQDGFGRSVGIWGNTILVGAPSEASEATGLNGDETDNRAEGAGAAYIFVGTGLSWLQSDYVKASNAEGGIDLGDQFGHAVAVSGNSLVIGACYEDGGAHGVDGTDSNDIGWSGAAYTFERGISQNYCTAEPSSQGLVARIHARGSRVFDENALALYVTDAPPARPGLFLFGEDQVQLPFGGGQRCISPIRKLHPPVRTTADGAVARNLDFDRQPLSSLLPTSLPRRWNFQFWYRDAGASNLTDGVAVEIFD